MLHSHVAAQFVCSCPGDTLISMKDVLLCKVGLDGAGAKVGDFKLETSVVTMIVKA